MHTGITTDTERVSSNIPEKNKIFDGDILFSWSATLEVMFWFGGNAGLNQHIFKIVPINGYTKEYVKIAAKTEEPLDNVMKRGRVEAALTDEIYRMKL